MNSQIAFLFNQQPDFRKRPLTTVLNGASNSAVQRGGSEGVGANLIGKGAQQQFVDAIDWALGDASDDMAEASLGIETVEFSGTDQCLDRGAAFEATVGAEAQEVFAA